MPQKPLQGCPDPLLISHGFQVNYERGFSNALASAGLRPVLVNSDRSDCAGMRPEVRLLNLRGSQGEDRPAWAKALNLLAYHLKLLHHVMRQRPALVHVIGLIHPAIGVYGLLHGLWHRLWAQRYVLTVHDLLPLHGRHTSMQLRLHRWAYALPHHLVVHTPRMRDGLSQRFGVAPQRITVMEHGIEPWPDGHPPPSATFDPTGTSRFRLLFFGRILPYKGLDVLLDALHYLRHPVELTICGRCRDATLVQQLLATLAALPSWVKADWRNKYIDEGEISGYFRRADAMVLPYRHIDQSGVLFQALRHGVPIVATNVGDFARYIESDIGEICAPEDPRALAQALERLIARRHQMSPQWIRQRATTFEWSKVVAILPQAYRPT